MEPKGHIHISPEGGEWHIQNLKRVANALIYFEPALEKLVPEHRRGSIWASILFLEFSSDFPLSVPDFVLG